MTWSEEYREGLADVAAALHRIADELAIANRIEAASMQISRADAEQIFAARRSELPDG